MKTMFKRETSATGAIAIASLLIGLLFATTQGCIGGFNEENISEGNRCNPLDSHDECASGLVCSGRGVAPAVPYCPENYCCSVDSNGNLNSNNANCQPGCNGGAASICAATKDPSACAVAAGMPPPVADAGTE
jgi:hypothetical protein